MSDKLITKQEVCDRLGIDKDELKRLLTDADFPAPRVIFGAVKKWSEAEVELWVEEAGFDKECTR